MSTLDHKLEPEVTAVHRLEVMTGTGRRRQFTDDFKARVVEETLVAGVVISDVARRHGLSPQQVFTWRRQARLPAVNAESKTPHFVPAVVDVTLRSPPGLTPRRRRARVAERSAASIEVEIEGMIVRIGRGAEAKTVAAVLHALKAGA